MALGNCRHVFRPDFGPHQNGNLVTKRARIMDAFIVTVISTNITRNYSNVCLGFLSIRGLPNHVRYRRSIGLWGIEVTSASKRSACTVGAKK